MSNPAADLFDKWDRDGRDAGMEEGHSDVVNQVVETMNIRPGDQILDLGCGNGTPCFAAASTSRSTFTSKRARRRPKTSDSRGSRIRVTFCRLNGLRPETSSRRWASPCEKTAQTRAKI